MPMLKIVEYNLSTNIFVPIYYRWLFQSRKYVKLKFSVKLMRSGIIILIYILTITICCYAQSDKNYEMIKASTNVYQFYQKDFVNMFAFIGDEGIVLIDTGFDDHADLIKKELAKIIDRKIKYIINTHSDYDHLAGNKKLREGAVVIAHENYTNDLIEYAKPGHPNPFDRSLFTGAMPDITFEEEMEIHFGGEIISIFSAIGGHTTSDIVVYMENENIAFIGDIFFTDSFPDVKDQEGVSIDNLLNDIDIILNELPEDVVIYVGHGEATNIEMMKRYKEMIEKTTTIVKTEIGRGRTLEEMQRENILKDWIGWSQTVFDELDCNKWIETIYNNYKER